MTASSITLTKTNPDEFSLLCKLNKHKHKQGSLLLHTISFIENIDNIACLNALSITCKFFNKMLKEKLGSFKLQKDEILKDYKDLINTVFESWQQIAKLPKQPSQLPNNIGMLDFLINGYVPKIKFLSRITRVLVRGEFGSTLPIIIFQTTIKNSDGSVKESNHFEILRLFTDGWKYFFYRYRYDCPINEAMTSRLKDLVNHKPVGAIDYISTLKNYYKPTEKTTINGKPIVELTSWRDKPMQNLKQVLKYSS